VIDEVRATEVTEIAATGKGMSEEEEEEVTERSSTPSLPTELAVSGESRYQ